MRDKLNELKSSPTFWEGAFLFAFVLLILSHKINIQAVME